MEEVQKNRPDPHGAPQDGITIGGIYYTAEDIIRIMTDRDMYAKFYNDAMAILRAGRPGTI